MRKDIVEVNKELGLVQITTADERWYALQSEDPKTKLPVYRYVPSASWIASYYPKGVEFYKWLAKKGWDESQAIKEEAGERGTRIHKAIELLLNGETVEIGAKLADPVTGAETELTPDEYAAVCSFVAWFKETQPEIMSTEITVVNEEEGYAGTVDFVCKIGGVIYIVDFKSGQNLFPSYEIQQSMYKHGLKFKDNEDGTPQEVRLAILQVGYRRNKKGYKFTEIEDKWELYKAARVIWANENSDAKPKQRDFPMQLSLAIKKSEHAEQQTNNAKSGNKAKAKTSRKTT